jgi:F-type H+-transporting ATPase subunit b
VFKSLIFLNTISVLLSGMVLAKSHKTDIADINWWGLGSRYAHSPALGWYFLTFAIFVLGLICMVRKPLGLYLAARSNEIRKAINEAEIAKEEAKKKMQACEERISHLDIEIAQMKAEFIKLGTMEKAQLEKTAKQMAIQIVKDADDVIAGNLRQTMYRLKKDMAVQVIALAREEIKNRTNQQIESRMRSEFSRDVSKLMH